MLAFWPEIVKPILSELRPTSLVEVGSESGKTTRWLIELAQSYGGVVHSIDPAPRFDALAWQSENRESFVFHAGRSLEVLPTLDRLDAVLIDGDHNWYTVYHELIGIERRVTEMRRAMPILFLHDIGWPYGRRDLYYEPDAIPDAYRHPYQRRGIHPAYGHLVDSGGINAHLCNAVHEGGPRNGVLTAIEDYLAATKLTLECVRIPAAFGLAIVAPKSLLDDHPAVGSFVRAWSDPRIERFIERLEIARIGAGLPASTR